MSQERIERARDTAEGGDGGTVVTDDKSKTGKAGPPPASRSGEEGGAVGGSETKAGKSAP